MIRPKHLVAALVALICAGAAYADDRSFTLSLPDEVVDSGLAQHLLPRFSLKTGIRVTLGAPADLTITTDGDGPAVFERGETVFQMGPPDSPAATRFADWLRSDVGRRTIEGFTPDNGAAFAPPTGRIIRKTAVVYEGDATLGADLSMSHCGRCHVVSEANRMNGLGSTPSFAALRAMQDWGSRFEAFFALNPHPSFTQITGVTEPFRPNRPSPIAPVELTLDDLDAILAYVAAIPPADLGAPIQHQ